MANALPAIYGPSVYAQTGITATGSNQATAYQLTAQLNTFSTVAASTAAILPVANAQITVTNNGTAGLALYPASGDQIDNNATNVAITVPANGGTWTGACTAPPTQSPPRVWETMAFNAVGAAPFVPVNNGITASTTQSLAGAVQLNAGLNNITVCATAGNAVKVPSVNTLNFGQVCTVFNNGASAAAVYPFETATAIDTHGTGASATLGVGHSANFFQNTASTWISQGSTAGAA